MLDTAILGGGLSGLALARRMQKQGRDCAVFEARDRVGGRILSVPADGMALDLGPAWYWPHTQPRMTRLIAELGLTHFAPHDQGTVLSLNEPDKVPQPYLTDGVHGGARRLEGGMASLVQALAANFQPDTLHLHHVLIAVIEQDNHVALHFRCSDSISQIAAHRVVLAVPPRLLEEHVRFEPQLVEPLCNAAGDRAALGGFIALSPALRASFQTGLPLLIASQLAALRPRCRKRHAA